MLVFKLFLVCAILALFIYFTIRLIKRGLSSRYEPKAKTPWSMLSEGEDPTL
jgi:hypothetical protein